MYKWSWFVNGWGSGQVPIFCQFSGSRGVHIQRLCCSKGPMQEIPALLQSHATFLAPAAQLWRYLPWRARPQSRFVILWKIIATAPEITGISNSRPPRKGTKTKTRHILQEIYCFARSTLFITNGLPCLCLRNKKTGKKNRKNPDTEVLLQNFFCKTEDLN